MKKKIKIDKLFEVGKAYQLKTGNFGWMFTITQDPHKRDKDGNIVGAHNTVWGIYENDPTLGVCPISIERLIPETELTGKEIDVCDHCGEEISATVAPESKLPSDEEIIDEVKKYEIQNISYNQGLIQGGKIIIDLMDRNK